MKAKLAGGLALAIAAAATFLGVYWWSTRGQEEALVASSNPTAAAMPPDTDDDLPAAGSAPVAAAKGEPASEVDEDTVASETAFRGFVTNKYRYLFRGNALTPKAKEALQAALIERERIATAIRTIRQSDDETVRSQLPPQQALLAQIDQKIGALLPSGAITAFDLLKDSDTEQYQLEDYAGGISNVAPVNDDDKQSILLTKLTYRKRFQQVLEDSRLMSGQLTREESKLAFAEVSRSLKSAKENYLKEVRQYLYNDEQYQLLSNYENTEYTEELAKLRRIAYGE